MEQKLTLIQEGVSQPFKNLPRLVGAGDPKKPLNYAFIEIKDKNAVGATASIFGLTNAGLKVTLGSATPLLVNKNTGITGDPSVVLPDKSMYAAAGTTGAGKILSGVSGNDVASSLYTKLGDHIQLIPANKFKAGTGSTGIWDIGATAVSFDDADWVVDGYDSKTTHDKTYILSIPLNSDGSVTVDGITSSIDLIGKEIKIEPVLRPVGTTGYSKPFIIGGTGDTGVTSVGITSREEPVYAIGGVKTTSAITICINSQGQISFYIQEQRSESVSGGCYGSNWKFDFPVNGNFTIA